MSFVEINLNDAQDLKTAPEGEYKLRIAFEPEPNPEKSFMNVTLQIVEPAMELLKDLRHPLFWPKDGDDATKINNKINNIKRFCEAFNVDFETGSMEILAEAIGRAVGNEAWAMLKQKEDEQYGDSNVVRRFSKSK